jgi:hypothetical protein
MSDDTLLIRIQSEWDGWRSAEVPLGDLREVHWYQPARAPHALVHAYISCASIATGDIPHDCDRRSSHALRVCILKSHTLPAVYAELAKRADEQPVWRSNTQAGVASVGRNPEPVSAAGVSIRNRGRAGEPRPAGAF